MHHRRLLHTLLLVFLKQTLWFVGPTGLQTILLKKGHRVHAETRDVE